MLLEEADKISLFVTFLGGLDGVATVVSCGNTAVVLLGDEASRLVRIAFPCT